MRRWTATTLAATLALFVLLPYLSLAADADTDVPICCRGKGAHRCAMRAAMAAEPSPSPEIPALRDLLCRCTVQRALAPAGRFSIYPAVAAAAQAIARSRPALLRQTRVFSRTSLGCSHQKRGPPVLSA